MKRIKHKGTKTQILIILFLCASVSLWLISTSHAQELEVELLCTLTGHSGSV